MKSLGIGERLGELDDAINPIVVKELRQAVQSKFVVAVLLLFLLIQLVFIGIYLVATGLSGQLHLAGDSILLWGLIWAYNPRGLKHKPLLRERDEVWVSRNSFLGRIGGAAANR